MAAAAYSDYLALRKNVRECDARGVRLSPEELLAGLRSTDAAERKRAWDIRRAGWAPHRVRGADLLVAASREKAASSVADIFVLDSAPLVKALAGRREGLQKELHEKGLKLGANGFRWCDLWARLPYIGAPAAFEAAVKEIEAVFELVTEGGGDFVRELAASGRVVFRGDRPHCVTPEGADTELVYLPESFRELRPQEIPVVAHEFGHALHCAYARRLAPGKNFDMAFAEFFSQLFEELAWRRVLAAAGGDRGALELGRLEQRVFDGLLEPALLELEEYVVPAAKRGGLTLERIEAAEDRIFRDWFGVPPQGALFWLRTQRLFDPENAFNSFVNMAGRALAASAAESFSRTGRMRRAAFDAFVLDTVQLDLRRWLPKHPDLKPW